MKTTITIDTQEYKKIDPDAKVDGKIEIDINEIDTIINTLESNDEESAIKTNNAQVDAEWTNTNYSWAILAQRPRKGTDDKSNQIITKKRLLLARWLRFLKDRKIKLITLNIGLGGTGLTWYWNLFHKYVLGGGIRNYPDIILLQEVPNHLISSGKVYVALDTIENNLSDDYYIYELKRHGNFYCTLYRKILGEPSSCAGLKIAAVPHPHGMICEHPTITTINVHLSNLSGTYAKHNSTQCAEVFDTLTTIGKFAVAGGDFNTPSPCSSSLLKPAPPLAPYYPPAPSLISPTASSDPDWFILNNSTVKASSSILGITFSGFSHYHLPHSIEFILP